MAVMLPSLYDIKNSVSFNEKHSLLLASSVLLLFFPLLSKLIFGTLPFEGIRNTILIRRLHLDATTDAENDDSNDGTESPPSITQVATQPPEMYLTNLTITSSKLARSIFTRAGVFLFIGGIIALSGIIFFYLNTPSSGSQQATDNMAASLAKHFGILFFIEFVAFFFLRQYRAAMDEFRYYESLQRSREETLAIVKLLQSTDEKIDVYQLIEKCGFRSGIEKLNSGQTTDLLESKKLNKDETEIFNKILDILGKK